MVLHIDGSGMYRKREDGSREYDCTTLLEINGRKVYDFDKENGILHVLASPSELEKLKRSLGEVPKEGKYLVLPNPSGLAVPARFDGVRSIESMLA